MSIFNIFKKKSPNNELHAAIKALEKTEILMMPQENASVKHPGASKIGGKPYLPADFEWPTFTSTDDDTTRHLSFFCQINLTEVKPYDNEGMLPDRGTLYFFYECESSCWGFDPQDHGAARVFWYDTTDLLNCVPLEIPADIAEECFSHILYVQQIGLSKTFFTNHLIQTNVQYIITAHTYHNSISQPVPMPPDEARRWLFFADDSKIHLRTCT